MLIMERRETAVKRGARVYGRLSSGVITSGSAAIGKYEIDMKHLGRAVLDALEKADMAPSDIHYFNVSANFCKEMDQGEYKQLTEIFGPAITVTPLKYLMGEFGGAGVIRAAASLLSLYYQQPLPVLEIKTLKEKVKDKSLRQTGIQIG